MRHRGHGALFNGPKAFLVGQANLMAKRPAAADAEWTAALQVVERLHAAQPNVARWIYWKARLFASLGRKEEAAEALKTFEQLSGAKGVVDDTFPIYLLLGRKDEVLTAFEKRHTTLATRGNATQLKGLVNMFRLNPELDLLRDEPRFQKLIAPPAAETETKK